MLSIMTVYQRFDVNQKFKNCNMLLSQLVYITILSSFCAVTNDTLKWDLLLIDC